MSAARPIGGLVTSPADGRTSAPGRQGNGPCLSLSRASRALPAKQNRRRGNTVDRFLTEQTQASGLLRARYRMRGERAHSLYNGMISSYLHEQWKWQMTNVFKSEHDRCAAAGCSSPSESLIRHALVTPLSSVLWPRVCGRAGDVPLVCRPGPTPVSSSLR